MNHLLLSFALLSAIPAFAQELPEFKNHFPLKWKTKIGGTTFKTNFVLHEGLLIVGSNGEHYRDWRIDKNSGVYFIDPTNGKILHRVADEGYGDMDVNGIVAENGRIFFGNDNEEFLCYDTCGRQIWRVPVSGDVEAEPVLLDIDCDGTSEIIFGTETGEVAALDSRNGKAIWSFKIKDFNGWNKTDNRFLFKIGAYVSNGRGFVSRPAVMDLNYDDVPDLIFNCRDNYTYAINGENGNLLWKFDHGEIWFLGNSPVTVQNGTRKNIYVLQNRRDKKGRDQLHFVQLNEKGILQEIYSSTWNCSVNYAPVLDANRLLSAISDSLVSINIQSGSLTKFGISNSPFFRNDNGFYKYYRVITARPLLFDILNSGDEQLIIVDEYGTLQVLDATSFQTLKVHSLSSGTETTPFIADIDDDGKLEMLISCYDGYFYCFSLKNSTGGSIAGLK